MVKISKGIDGIVSREVLTQKWTDRIDYWSVDFDFESRREILRVKNPGSGEIEEVWTGDFVFENKWQSFSEEEKREIVFKNITTGNISHTTLLNASLVTDFRSVIGYFS